MLPVLAWLVLLPVIGAIIVALIPAGRRELLLPVGVGVSMAPLVVAGYMLWEFEVGPEFQFGSDVTLSSALDIGWRVAVDGISLFLVVLTTLRPANLDQTVKELSGTRSVELDVYGLGQQFVEPGNTDLE